jgi:2-polyprenyl-3-methyl-5-hydroxy-6-metoxy-1,4-benzoquinol methylase
VYKIDYKYQKKCRLCDNKHLSTVIDLNKTPLANSFLKKKELKKKEKYYPLKVNFCKKCFHLQLSHIVNAKNMFDDYLYLTNTSRQNVDHFKSYAKKIKKIMNTKEKLSILDIASNDGTFLKFFNKKKYNRLGIDPAKNLSKFTKKLGISQLQMYFTFDNSKIIKKRFKRFNIITANHVCAHVSDLIDFFKGVKNLLDINGIFVFEISYLGSVIKKKIFDTIYHEHADYHALKPLIQFVKRFGLEIFDFEIVKAQGGSLRVYTCNAGSKKINKEKIKKQIFFEKNILKLFQPSTYRKFEKEIIKVKDKLNIILNKLKKDKKKVAGYGAAAKTTTLLNYFNINKNTINFIVDDNPLKQNRYSPGTHIPIKSSNEIYKKKPDYIIILAWNYASHIINLHKKFKKIKGKFIIPFPKIKIL